MPTVPEHERVRRWLPLITGGVLIAAPFLLNALTEGEYAFPAVSIALIVSGCAIAVTGAAARSPKFGAGLARASLAILSMMFALAACEGAFRLVSFDFDRPREPGDEIPIYFRQPTLHAGEGVFRRPGPAAWRGQALLAYMRMRGTNDGPYTEEAPVLAEYDAFGFRNPTNLFDWDAVVAGDSFVELGYLPYEDLFTTLAARRLGIRIKNLGVSGTGPISQTFYLKNYGKAASVRDAVLCFFEGNDLEDLSRELRNAESFRVTGRAQAHRPQCSLIKAIGARLFESHPASTAPFAPNATLVGVGPERPMTVYGRPPAWSRLAPAQREALLTALKTWAETARVNGMRPWVMYLPDSHRVFHGFIRYTNCPVAGWMPADFASGLGTTCTNLEIEFIDTLPALRREVEGGHIPYNLIGDTHLSREGSRVVAEVLAGALGASRARLSGKNPAR